MPEFCFDAMVTVTAENQDAAVKLILEHNLNADIAVALFKERTLNTSSKFVGTGFRKESRGDSDV